MNCNIELLRKTLEAKIDLQYRLADDECLPEETKDRHSYEAAVLFSVLQLIENEELLNKIASIYDVK